MSDSTLIDLAQPEDLAHLHSNDVLMAKTLSEALQRHYPGHLWAVNVEARTGLITIRDMYLAGNWAYVLKMGAIYSASALEKDVIRAGGEILERFRMQRGSFDSDSYASAPVDFAGRLLFDKS